MIIIHWGCPIIKKNNLVDNGGEFYCPIHQTLLETMGVSDRSDRFFQTAHVLAPMDVAVTWSLDSAHLCTPISFSISFISFPVCTPTRRMIYSVNRYTF